MTATIPSAAAAGSTCCCGAGEDVVYGEDGDDVLHGGSDNDAPIRDDGNDRLFGGAGDDDIDGGFLNDTIKGGTGDDTLRGGDGNDTNFGGTSFDTMNGGLGQDTFVFESNSEIGTVAGARDVIDDFVSGEDIIDLAGVDANTVLAGNQAFVFIGAGNFTGVAGQLRYSAVDGLLQGDTNGDAVADFSLELANRPALLAGDIIL
jgi:Ca2+-binding RTX toxin-like protein